MSKLQLLSLSFPTTHRKCLQDQLGGVRAPPVRCAIPQLADPHLAGTNVHQSVRSYATEAPKTGSSSTPYIVGGLAVAAGFGGYTFLGKNASADAPAPQKEAEKLDKRAFTGGDQGFIDLKLKESKDYNHNTKRFIFELPEADQVSGMNVACEWSLKTQNRMSKLTNWQPPSLPSSREKTRRSLPFALTLRLATPMRKAASSCWLRSIPMGPCQSTCMT